MIRRKIRLPVRCSSATRALLSQPRWRVSCAAARGTGVASPLEGGFGAACAIGVGERVGKDRWKEEEGKSA